MSVPSFSKLDLAKFCTFTFKAPIAWPNDPPREFTHYGTAVSRVAEVVSIFGEAPVTQIADECELKKADRLKLDAAAIHLERLLNGQASTDLWRCAELALAYNTLTGTARALPQRHARDYSDAREDELCGTAGDIVRVRSRGGLTTCNCRVCNGARGVLVVSDYKTGQYMKGRSPSKSGQLCASALAAAAYLGHTGDVVVELVQVEERGEWIKFDFLDAWQLAAIHKGLRELYEWITGPGHDVPRPGPWCAGKYCPIRANCPATIEAERLIAAAAESPFPLTGQIKTPEQAAWIRHRLKVLEALIAERDHEVKEYARDTPIPIGEGRFYGLVEKSQRSLDCDVKGVVGVLRRHLGDVADEAIEIKTGLGKINAAALKVAKAAGGKGAPLNRAILADLKEIGALKESTFSQTEEYTPKEIGAEGK